MCFSCSKPRGNKRIYDNKGIKFYYYSKNDTLYFINIKAVDDCLKKIPILSLSNKKESRVIFLGDICNFEYCCSMTSEVDSVVESNGIKYYFVTQYLGEKEAAYETRNELNKRRFKFSRINGIEYFENYNIQPSVWPY